MKSWIDLTIQDYLWTATGIALAAALLRILWIVGNHLQGTCG